MSASPQSRRADSVVDTVAELVREADRPLLWYEVVDAFYQAWKGGFVHERTLYRHACAAARRGLIGVHGLPRQRVYTKPGVRLSREALRVVQSRRGRSLGEEDLL